MRTQPPSNVVRRSAADIDLRPVQRLIERIKTAYKPRQIWLFGSRARGDAKADSDWDFLVVVGDDADDATLDPRRTHRLQRGLPVYADIVPCRAQEFEDNRYVVNNVCYSATHEGFLLHER